MPEKCIINSSNVHPGVVHVEQRFIIIIYIVQNTESQQVILVVCDSDNKGLKWGSWNLCGSDKQESGYTSVGGKNAEP